LLPCKKRIDEKGCYQFYFTVIKAHEHNAMPTKKISSNNKLWWLLSIIIFIIFWAFKWWKEKLNDNTNFIEIGKYQLNKTTMELVFKAQKVTLSAKETDLLYLLYTNCNTTLEKGYILEAVWGDSGDYVGRTLDVYISKLRKKLALDTRIKIINVRGVGYRLVLV
jgi:DNA-binding response OmpR family regulator